MAQAISVEIYQHCHPKKSCDFLGTPLLEEKLGKEKAKKVASAIIYL